MKNTGVHGKGSGRTNRNTYTHHTGKVTRWNAERQKIGERMAYISGFANTSNGVIRKWL